MALFYYRFWHCFTSYFGTISCFLTRKNYSLTTVSDIYLPILAGYYNFDTARYYNLGTTRYYNFATTRNYNI